MKHKIIKKGTFWGLFCCAVLQMSVTAAPSWRTAPPGQAPTTYQKWTFDDGDNPAAPEISSNPYGTASAQIFVLPGTVTPYAEWRPSYQGHYGVWIGDTATAVLTIPNSPVSNTYKEIWVEVGCRGHFPPEAEFPPMEGFGLGTGYTVVNPQNSVVEDLGYTFVNQIPLDGWLILNFGLRIYPNPDSETISFTLLNSGAYIDYITVDTLCIPEPVTLLLLSFGGLFCIRLKRG